MPEPASLPRRPLQFRSGDSVVHRLGAGWKLLITTVVGALALAVDALPALVAILGLVAAGYVFARLSLADLWRDLRWLLLQAAIVVVLTLLVRGGDAWVAGCRTALQLMLVFLPVALMLRTTSSQRLLESVQRWMPEHLAFAFGATLRFVPVFVREGGDLVEMQRMRGARLAARDLWRPGAWRDWLACVALPMTVRAIEVAEEAADAATLRGIGRGFEPAARDGSPLETTRKEMA